MENAAREAAQAVVDLVGPVKEPRRPDGVIGSAVSVAFVMMEDSREPTPEEQREMEAVRAIVESKNTDPTQRIAVFCGPGNNGGTASPPPASCWRRAIVSVPFWWAAGRR